MHFYPNMKAEKSRKNISHSHNICHSLAVLLAIIAMLAAMLFSFSGCGTTDSTLSSSENEEEDVYITDEKGDKYLLIDSDSLEIIDGDYEIYDAYSEVITRQGLNESDLYFTAVNTTEDGAEAEAITPSDGCTSLNVDFLLVNIKDLNDDGSIKDEVASDTDENGKVNAKDYFDGFSGKVVYNGSDVYKCTAYQENLEQTDSNGNIVRSTKAVKLGSGDAARMSLIADIPLTLSDRLEERILAQAGDNDDETAGETAESTSAEMSDKTAESTSDETFFCFFTINGDRYAVDLFKETSLIYY